LRLIPPRLRRRICGSSAWLCMSDVADSFVLAGWGIGGAFWKWLRFLVDAAVDGRLPTKYIFLLHNMRTSPACSVQRSIIMTAKKRKEGLQWEELWCTVEESISCRVSTV
jgi:hypothetical protein